MSWRTVVISSSAKLDYKLDYLVVRREETVKIHLSEIYVLIIESTAVSLTAALLSELTKRKIKVIFCDEKRNPSSELIPYYGCHDTSAKIRAQLEWTKETKTLVWTEIVSEKIRNQMKFLKKLNLEQYTLLEQYISQIEKGDVTNREGHAAKVYFNALFGMSFTRTADIPTNAALNYGYGIILSAFNREIVANGYITQLGLFHDNMFNSFNLGSDLMEPFRLLVDELVYYLNPDKFEKDEKMAVLDVLNKEVIIDGKKNYVTNAIKIYCRSVFDAINEQDVSVIKFYRDEL
jgi:CRISPR-associated endonuclease Cas1 subtype II